MELPSDRRSIGVPTINSLPANRSLILADSRFRSDEVLDDPYNFLCDLGGSGIYAKEFFYQKLYWNQPLFSHNSKNCELLFQLNGDENTTYVTYATPFQVYTQLSKENGSMDVLGTPLPASYASNMEMGLNGDLRIMPYNTTRANLSSPTPGFALDSNGDPIYIRFRYSPGKGFCIYPEQNPSVSDLFSIRLLPCSYIANAHFVHGFGVYDPKSSLVSENPLQYVPQDFWCVAYWSDVTPTLLPFRYIVVKSDELCKDRRLISFHNGQFSNFINELAVFPLNYLQNGVYHENVVGDDATVVSFRSDYTPQSFRISLLDEFGKVLECDNPIKYMIESGALRYNTTQSYWSTTYYNRGNHNFMNYILFGYRTFPRPNAYTDLQIKVAYFNALYPAGMINQDYNNVGALQRWVPNRNKLSFANFNMTGVQYLDSLFSRMYVFTPSTLIPLQFQDDPGNLYGGEGTGLQIRISPYANNYIDPLNPANGLYTPFEWYHKLNPEPVCEVYWDCNVWVPLVSVFDNILRLYIIMFNSNDYTIYQISGMDFGGSSGTMYNNVRPTNGNYKSSSWMIISSPEKSDDYPLRSVPVGFALCWCQFTTGSVGFVGSPQMNDQYLAYNPAIDQAKFYNPSLLLPTPQNVVPNCKEFGNPKSDGKCEDLIHEIVTVLEYN